MGFHQIKWKLLVAYLSVVALCLAVVIVITREMTINSYSEHLQLMSELGMGAMMGNGMATDLVDAFRRELNISLLWGGLSAAGLAVLLSVIIGRRITRPIHDMAAVTEKIAEGDYSERVQVSSADEIGRLGHSLNQMAAGLEESRRMRRELMANIAHELRTPLTSISGYMEGLADGVMEPSPEIFSLVHGEAQRLSRLVDDLQKLSRAEAGQESLDIVDLPLAPLLQGTKRKLEPPFQEKGVGLQVTVAPGIPNIRADEDKMGQILVNLLGNALRYTDSGGKVSVAAHASDGRVMMDVTDTGIGISPEDQAHIFERFYRADKSRSRERGGSGIGLTIARSYARALGGDITVSSQEGRGSTFTVNVPAADGHRMNTPVSISS